MLTCNVDCGVNTDENQGGACANLLTALSLDAALLTGADDDDLLDSTLWKYINMKHRTIQNSIL